MNTLKQSVSKFLWWSAAIDPVSVGDSLTPPADRIKYSAIGSAVLLTTTVATLGWAHLAYGMFDDSQSRLIASGGMGALMGALIFCQERVLISSIRHDIVWIGKLGAGTWRSVLASFSALLLLIPFALAFFKHDTHAQLDAERLALMADKRHAIEQIYDTRGHRDQIRKFDGELAANAARKAELPPAIEQVSRDFAFCEEDRMQLARSLEPKISSANAQYNVLVRRLQARPEEGRWLRSQLTTIRARTERWRGALTAKLEACRAIAGRFEAARDAYYREIEQERQTIIAGKDSARRKSDAVTLEADKQIQQSDMAVLEVTSPNIGARLRALVKLASENTWVGAFLAIGFGFFFMIDMMPILSKLVMPTTLDYRNAARARALRAEADAEAAISAMHAEQRTAIAAAELAALGRLIDRNEAEFATLAGLAVDLEIQKAEVRAPFERIIEGTEAYAEAQGRIDEILDRFKTDSDALSNIEQSREALRKAMREFGSAEWKRAAASTRRQAA